MRSSSFLVGVCGWRAGSGVGLATLVQQSADILAIACQRAAINGDDLSGDHLGAVAGEKADEFADVLRQAHAPERYRALDDLFAHLRRADFFYALGQDAAGADGIDVDAMLGGFPRQMLGNAGQGVLGGGVDEAAKKAHA